VSGGYLKKSKKQKNIEDIKQGRWTSRGIKTDIKSQPQPLQQARHGPVMQVVSAIDPITVSTGDRWTSSCGIDEFYPRHSGRRTPLFHCRCLSLSRISNGCVARRDTVNCAYYRDKLGYCGIELQYLLIYGRSRVHLSIVSYFPGTVLEWLQNTVDSVLGTRSGDKPR
jgi:hypothetical protein